MGLSLFYNGTDIPVYTAGQFIEKSRADKYDEKLAIKGSFADVFKVVKKNKEDKNERSSPQTR